MSLSSSWDAVLCWERNGQQTLKIAFYTNDDKGNDTLTIIVAFLFILLGTQRTGGPFC
jgi:hypothetical protein